MRRFEYARPESVEEAVDLLASAEGEAWPLAGGTDLLGLMKDDVVRPSRLVDLRGIEELGRLVAEGDRLRLGATVSLQELLDDERVARLAPALADAARGVAGLQMRRMGTLGGELLQRPRCWYFRRGFGLLALRDGRSLVAAGDSRFHAVLGNEGPAKFVCPSRLAAALVALGAEAEVVGSGGPRTLPVADLYRTPRRDGERETTLAPEDVLAAVVVPRRPPTQAAVEIRQRAGLDLPEASACVALGLDAEGRLQSVRIALGHVAPVPWFVDATDAVAGRKPDDAAARAAAAAALAGATPLSGNAHKVQIARAAVRRAFVSAAGRAG